MTHRFEHRCKNSRGWREAHLAKTTLASIETFIDQTDDWHLALKDALVRELASRAELDAEGDMLDLRIDRLFDALEKGIKMDWERLRQLQDRRDEIRALPPVPDISVSHAEIKKTFYAILDHIRNDWDDQKYAAPIRALLNLVVERIVCTPIEGKARGETVDIQLKPAAEWASMFIYAHTHWPHVEKLKPQPSSNDQLHSSLGYIATH